MAPSLNLLPNLHRDGLVVRTAPVPFRRRFLSLIYTFLSYFSIFYQYNLFCSGSRCAARPRALPAPGGRLGELHFNYVR